MIKIDGLSKRYQLGEETVAALRGVRLTIEPGEFVAIMGPSGSGKSTLMNLLGLLDIPDDGVFELCGQNVAHLNESALADVRRKTIGFIFQQFHLLPSLNALENVMVPLVYSHRQDIQHEEAASLLRRVGLGQRMDHRPSQLSGGQQQRVAVARALINQPKILLADEPTGNLDVESTSEVLRLLRELNAQGITIILVTHDEKVARHAKRVLVMSDGQIISDQLNELSVAADVLAPSDTSSPTDRVGVSDLTPVDASDVNAAAGNIDSSAFQRSMDWIQYEMWPILDQGWQALSRNRLRTALSMLGILMGVAAFIAMLAVGRGASEEIEKQMLAVGSNLLSVWPTPAKVVGGGSAGAGATEIRLTEDDARSIEELIPGVREASPIVVTGGAVTANGKGWYTRMMGVTPGYAKMHGLIPKRGRFFTDEDDQMRSMVAVIGQTLARELYGDQNPVGEIIKFNKLNLQVIGVLPAKGATNWADEDDVIIVPIQTGIRRMIGKKWIDVIDIEVDKRLPVAEVKRSVVDLMLSRHYVPPSHSTDAFRIRNLSEAHDAMMKSSRTMSILLASIAAISLIVGGIGIMNIMLMSIHERKKEIGLRKAVGASHRDILLQFLSEAGVIGCMGGVLGVLSGLLACALITWLAGMVTSISFGMIAFALIVSVFVGLIFGLWPAHQAALTSPIVAMK